MSQKAVVLTVFLVGIVVVAPLAYGVGFLYAVGMLFVGSEDIKYKAMMINYHACSLRMIKNSESPIIVPTSSAISITSSN